ncbi:SPW repeat protein [Dactylosporangium roseum]|uniref:SPW repeat protein n=1 Tax=Dactylosporangium roseum TaxID=47989 RepID=A0ABY5Z7T7_9ACTN|nr:SPW repeat protein [Dactylosporangium roseum]UWZ36449.1 SPW repeat protein [Dactylosporangium roseum]
MTRPDAEGFTAHGSSQRGGVGGARTAIQERPDVAALRARYDQAAETPTSQSVDGLMFLSGVFLAVSPWVVGFRSAERDLAINNLIIGIVVALLAASYATVYGRTHGLSWAPVLLGLWTIVAPWVIQGSDVAGGTVATNVITGVLITACGLGTMRMGRAVASRTSR